ncbi:ras GEF [Ascodesmis nigricans]|uniref:Class E vacuolar protein-sorting machinery protein HSE1 n=1 Tax=Ascodesmis nigricans TaxID=341454 RepID=A0A4S2N8K2_9PEZI|nr:ras GEF [Ascodesmis nigricans]
MIVTTTTQHSPEFSRHTAQIDQPGSMTYHGYANGNGAPLERSRSGDVSTDDEGQDALQRSDGRIPSRLYVRALYNYSTDDPTSLSFNQGDVIQVLKQLDSGWWDGIVNNQRGWFPSNYCAVIQHNELLRGTGNSLEDSDDMDEDDSYDDYDDDDEEEDSDHGSLASPGLPLEGTDDKADDEAAFWIPQATPDGRLYYFNTITGVFRTELPLEAPTSSSETGPRDRQNITVPDITRPPPEVLAQGYDRDEASYRDHDDDDSASERGGGRRRRMTNGSAMTGHSRQLSNSVGSSDYSRVADRDSEATLLENNQRAVTNMIFRPSHNHSFSVSTDNTVLHSNDSIHTPHSLTYFDDGIPIPTTWNELIERIGIVVDRYRDAINTFDHANYVRRAEDISDMLRLLITAGSATTDNHSGNPSIISANRTLNPHFRHFMAAFSKLVLSSHVAATECRPADAETKCLAEADEVMVGVHGFAQTAKAQRGEQLPRLKPGFVRGSHAGAGWRGLMAQPESPQSPMGENGMVPLNTNLIDQLEVLNNAIKNTLQQLEASLEGPGHFVSAQGQAIVGNNVVHAAKVALEDLRRFLNLLENVSTVPLTRAESNPTVMDFVDHKQRLHDSVADLFMACQTATAPLADEWTYVRADTMMDRLNAIRTYIRDVTSSISNICLTVQFLVSAYEESEELDGLAGSPHQANGRGHGARPSQHMIEPSAVPSKVKKLLGETPQPVPEKPKYLLCDHEKEMCYGVKGQLKGGTLVALVERLTRHDNLDSGFNTTFLLTYPSFTTGPELFEQLKKRYTVQPPPALTQEQFQDWVEQKQKLVRMRVLSILKMWLESNWMEPRDDNTRALLRSMYQFAQEQMSQHLPGTKQIINLIDTRLKGGEPENKKLVPTMAQPPAPILPKTMHKKLKLLDIDALEFARQLTIIEYRSYAKLKPSECLSKGWSKLPGKGPDPAENVRAIINQSNQLTSWVAEVILGQVEVRKRVLVIKHFVNIAEKCRQLNNFSTLTSILAALQASAIHRLKRTWEGVPQRTQQQLAALNTLMGASMNFADYRENLHLVNPPCVPFLGVYLKDLTFVADGNDDFLKDSNLINFGKRVRTANIIQEIQQYQAVPYALTPVPELQEFILHSMHTARDVNDMYPVSLTLEPREREDEKIARYK